MKWQHWRETYLHQSKPHPFNLIPQINSTFKFCLHWKCSILFHLFIILFFFFCFCSFSLVYGQICLPVLWHSISFCWAKKFYSNAKHSIKYNNWMVWIARMKLNDGNRHRASPLHTLHSFNFICVFKNDGIYNCHISVYFVLLPHFFASHSHTWMPVHYEIVKCWKVYTVKHFVVLVGRYSELLFVLQKLLRCVTMTFFSLFSHFFFSSLYSQWRMIQLTT